MTVFLSLHDRLIHSCVLSNKFQCIFIGCFGVSVVARDLEVSLMPVVMSLWNIYIYKLNFKEVIIKNDNRFIFPADPMDCPAVRARSALRRGTQRGLRQGRGK